MVPGNISMVLAETNGLQVQVTSLGLGAANIRIRGLDGRYTQVLADGLRCMAGKHHRLVSFRFRQLISRVLRQLQAQPLRYTAGIIALWEVEGKGRIGIEAYFTGKQRLEGDPFRTVSRPFVQLRVSGELKLGAVRLFVNLENILDARQQRYSRLVRPTSAIDGRRTVDAWRPLEGFVANIGVRFKFGD